MPPPDPPGFLPVENLSISGQWNTLQVQIGSFENQDNSGDSRQDITTSHWVKNNERSQCSNPKCSLSFSLTERKHHCRRCGDIFCNKCVSYERKLNHLSHPDPLTGKLRKVCFQCFDYGPQTIGKTVSHFSFFIYLRQRKQQQDQQKYTDDVVSKLDVLRECERLLKGFETSVGNSRLKSAVQDLISPVNTPSWQKSFQWDFKNNQAACTSCKKGFNLISKKHRCKVCGEVVCKQCSCTDLLLYLHHHSDNHRETKWAIIRIVGCPDKEPPVCLYLRVCQPCNSQLQDIQVNNFYQDTEDCDDVVEKLVHLHQKIVKIQWKIDEYLPKYQSLIEGMDIAAGSPKALPQTQSNIKLLAKSQIDLLDHFTSLVMTVKGLKNFRPNTDAQMKLIRNLITAKFQYYHENMHSFRLARQRMENSIASEDLEKIQGIVDSQAINGAYLSTLQLAYETLHICMKYNLEESVAFQVKSTAELIGNGDLKKDIEQMVGENWTDHQQRAQELIKTQLQGDREDVVRFIKLSRRRLKLANGKLEYIQTFLPYRCEHLIRQVVMQLTEKSSDKKFVRSKEALDALHRCLLDITEGSGKIELRPK